MHTIKKAIFGTVMFVLVLSSSAWAGEWPQCSGFLSECESFVPDPDRPGAFRYEVQGFDAKAYTKIIFDPVEIWFHPDSEYKGVKPEKLKALADGLRAVLMTAVEGVFEVVDAPGPRTLRVRAAITNVISKKPKRTWYNYTPVGAISVGIKKAAGRDYALDEAVFEVELLNSKTDVRLGALIDTKVSAKKGKKPGKWKDVEKSFEFYGNRFRQRMAKAKGQ